jgi:hypothetical protein
MIGSMTSRTSMRELGYMAEPDRVVEPDGSVSQYWPTGGQHPYDYPDAYDCALPYDPMTAAPIMGRIDQRTREDETNNGRDGLFATFLLVTPSPVEGRARIIDGATIYEIAGPPWAVWDSKGIHHYEASMERMTG